MVVEQSFLEVLVKHPFDIGALLLLFFGGAIAGWFARGQHGAAVQAAFVRDSVIVRTITIPAPIHTDTIRAEIRYVPYERVRTVRDTVRGVLRDTVERIDTVFQVRPFVAMYDTSISGIHMWGTFRFPQYTFSHAVQLPPDTALSTRIESVVERTNWRTKRFGVSLGVGYGIVAAEDKFFHGVSASVIFGYQLLTVD